MRLNWTPSSKNVCSIYKKKTVPLTLMVQIIQMYPLKRNIQKLKINSIHKRNQMRSITCSPAFQDNQGKHFIEKADFTFLKA